MIHIDKEGCKIVGELDELIPEITMALDRLSTIINDDVPVLPLVLSAYYIHKSTPDVMRGEVDCKKAVELFKKDTLKALEFIEATNNAEGSTLDEKLEIQRRKREEEEEDYE